MAVSAAGRKIFLLTLDFGFKQDLSFKVQVYKNILGKTTELYIQQCW